MSRLPFAIADLGLEIRHVTGQAGAEIRLGLDLVTFNAVVGELENHLGRPLRRDPGDTEIRIDGVLITQVV